MPKNFKVNFAQNLEVGYRGDQAVYVIADGIRTDFFKCDGTDNKRKVDSHLDQAKLDALETKAASTINYDFFARMKLEMQQDKK